MQRMSLIFDTENWYYVYLHKYNKTCKRLGGVEITHIFACKFGETGGILKAKTQLKQVD